MCWRSPRNTGTREKPCSKISRTTLKLSVVDSGSMKTSSSGVMTSCTDFSFISSAPRMTLPDSSSRMPWRRWTFMYWSISRFVCTVPTSSPSSASSAHASGNAMGLMSTMKSLTMGSVDAPM